MKPDLQIVSNSAALAEQCATQVTQLAVAAASERGAFHFCVSGGSTPRGVYARLAQPDLAGQIDWSRVFLYFGDERCVPQTDAQSNYRMLHEALLAHVPIPPSNVHRIAGEQQPAAAAAAYEQLLRHTLGVDASGQPQRAFDLVFLGLGADAHTASLFPGSQLETQHWASPRQQPSTQQWRITLTEPVLNAARDVMFLITGADKVKALHEVLRGAEDLQRLPGQRIRPRGRLQFWLDQAAAASV